MTIAIRHQCEAKTRLFSANDRTPPYCRQRVGLVHWTDRLGVTRYACRPHVAIVERLYGRLETL